MFRRRLTVQQQLAKNMVLEVGYTGSASTHLPELVDINQTLPLFQGSSVMQPVQYQSRQYPGLASFYGHEQNDVSANYNSLGAKLEKRWSSGLSFLTAFTWARDSTLPRQHERAETAQRLHTFGTEDLITAYRILLSVAILQLAQSMICHSERAGSSAQTGEGLSICCSEAGR